MQALLSSAILGTEAAEWRQAKVSSKNSRSADIGLSLWWCIFG